LNDRRGSNFRFRVIHDWPEPAAGSAMSVVPQAVVEVRATTCAGIGLRGLMVRLARDQAPKPEPRIMRCVLTDFEWAAIKPKQPNKPCGIPRIERAPRAQWH
jgi:hypothetical protein